MQITLFLVWFGICGVMCGILLCGGGGMVWYGKVFVVRCVVFCYEAGWDGFSNFVDNFLIFI